MTKEEFMNKHNLTELDYRNLVRFNQGLDLLNITEESIDDYIKLVVKNNRGTILIETTGVKVLRGGN